MMNLAEDIRRAKADYDDVYNAGFAAGQAGGGDGYEEGFEDGKQAEYDRFWDAYQQNGNRTDYNLAFAGIGWTNETFKPKYLIRPTSNQAYQIFARTTLETLDESILDFSQVTQSQMGMYMSYYLKNVTIDISSFERFESLFNYGYALKNLVLKNVPETCVFTGGFDACRELTNVTITGTIGGDAVNLKDSSKLTRASIENIVEHLSDTATGKSLTLSKKAVDAAFHDPEGEDVIGSASADWNSLMESKPNWTITLV